ncbi:DUF502 domain-containing protein [Nitrospirales bacterium NOB]|nr:MAG: hypothetical protein UZ03_NOB001001144 [Nitrospira sp. OLB3]MBV6468940.1 hypothetical protein [Nitrospirota bacterium]MCE7966735.1 DUF502 domain-containing protein [Nitrospira sp. NTP2]MCK6493678.1 DUF502 domain-containing protein [Nitrospira sp.]MDL1890656.1 DUF502 domain-containing protein [Nitrospirales bacterium NOB]MEB2338223.1 DUF502 domain-containing protein [Nitrospirales bacterium]
MALSHRLGRIFLTGLLVLLPAWTTFLILVTMFDALDSFLLTLVGGGMEPYAPGLGLLILIAMVLIAGAVATHVLGQQLVQWTERTLERIPLIRSIYLTLKSMTDLLNYRARFGRSTVVAFPFPRDGLWALGFVMGSPPPALQVAPMAELVMVFVPTAIHPFTGYLAMIPKTQLQPLNLLPEEALKLEFSAGLYRPLPGWLTTPTREPT